MVRLTDVYPDGRSMLLVDGALRLASRTSSTELEPMQPGMVAEAVVDLWSTSIVFNSGHRIRVSVTSSNWPWFSVNRNNGLPYPESVNGPASPVRVNIHHAEGAASYIELPMPSRDPTEVVRCDPP
jgi:putative CocE/NonD family hydrolase